MSLLDLIKKEDDKYISISDFIKLIANNTKDTSDVVIQYLGKFCLSDHLDVRVYIKGFGNGYSDEFHLSDLIFKDDKKDDFRFYTMSELKKGEDFSKCYLLKDEVFNIKYIKELNLKSEIEKPQVTYNYDKTLSKIKDFELSELIPSFESKEIENPIDRRMEDNRRKYIAVSDFVNNLSKGRSFKEGGSFGAGNPLKIAVGEILEKNLLNDINLYKLRGTEYLLVSQADKFKYKNAAEILRSFYDILDDDQTGIVSSDREPFEGFYFKYSEVGYLIGSDSKAVEKESLIHIDKQLSTNSLKSLDNSSMINNLGENQRLLTTYALFTPEDLTCLLIDENPACISHNDNYLRHHHMVSNAIDAKLLTLNDEGKILAEQVKIWLASHGFVYKGFNDGTLTYADQLAEMKEEAIAANVKVLNLTAKLEDAELNSIIHNHTAHKFLMNDAQANIDEILKENAELRANKKIGASQAKYDDEVSDQTVEKLKKMTADYEELSLKYERINTQNKELLDKNEQHQQDNNEELIQHWEAESKKYQSKIEDLETVIEGFSDVETLSQDGDWQLYNWETMNVSQYPPELHLATEVWKRYYKASDTEDITQFNTNKFDRITRELNLKHGKLKGRIRSILTPLRSKKTSADLLATLRDVDILYNDKMPD